MLTKLSEWLFGASDLAPHGYCLLWEPGLVWLYAISDTAIGLAYFSIPLALVVIGRRRGDLVFRPMLWLFAAFILACGATHLLDVVTLWTPLYGLQGGVKALTAIASAATAVALWWTLPSFLSLPSARQLSEANAALLDSEERLAHAQKMEAIGRLTGGIAHDFNNVLQVITGSLGVIERQVARGRGNEIAPSIAAIRKASSTASRLINRMLAFARRQTLEPRIIDPDRLILGLEEMLRRTLGPDVSLDLQPGHGGWSVICDPSQLESALLNLAVNARDAMPKGGALRIATADRRGLADPVDPGRAPADYVEIEVTDTGVGMEPEVLSRVFEPFFTTKPTGKGTGLGLSQIYGFARQSGGFVRIDSRPGDGTSVRLYLPGEERPLLVSEEELRPATTECACGNGRTALLVEDQIEVRMQIASTLEGIGCAVVQAEDGSEGLKILRSGAPLDLLVTDLGLPGVDGRRLAEAARVDRSDLPILLVTGYAGKSLDGLQGEPNIEILHKPFTLDELEAKVEAMLCRGAPAG
ncbi:ATP-binding protein [Methylosinus sp. Sm6]|uniref:ATP-binding protein n=1 Tax=Methylosinus sp. Sm6 TaxID=2866948 RepID=UPI001C99550B|nr:ATP-binding protein [Methylosinus sp. Sm6]MBY6242962.1 response regulator [Methylosinus sp. Sm6]